MDELLKKLKGLPIAGALFKGADGGSTSSEFGLLAGLIALATANASTMSLALGICLGGLGVGVGLFALARGRTKTEALAIAAAPKAAALLVLFLLPGLLLGGCAAAGAGTDAGLQTHSWSAGAVAAAEVHDIDIRIETWPAGMGTWSPEQLAAFVTARAAAGMGFGDVLASRQEVEIGSDQMGGTGGTATLDVRPTTSLSPPAGPGAASAIGTALGVGGQPGPARAPDRPAETPPAGGGK